MSTLNPPSKRWSRIVKERSGSILPIFAVTALPLIFAVGGAVDYGRLTNAQGRMQTASDGVALMISKDLEGGASLESVRGKLPELFSAELGDASFAPVAVDYAYDAKTYTVTVTARATIRTTFLALAGIDNVPVSTQSTAVNGSDYVEIALVLDNTGSMSSAGKLTQLKLAAQNMIGELENTPSGKAGKISVSVVPFSVPVRVETSNVNAPWLGPPEHTSVCWGSGWNRVCTTVEKTWNGCIGDRPSPYTTTRAAAVSGSSLYPRYYGTCNIADLLPLTNDLGVAHAKVGEMIASGNTNIPVGLMWGWNMLTVGAPLSTARVSTEAERVTRYLILLTDGDNTQNALGSSVSRINDLTRDTCTAVKSDKITLFTIRVINGNASLLRSCATSSSYYYDVTNASMLTAVFQQIMANITRLRLSS